MDAGRFLPVSCEGVWSERSRAGNLQIVTVRTGLGQHIPATDLLHGRTHGGQHLQGLPHHVELAAGLGWVVLVVRGEVGGGRTASHPVLVLCLWLAWPGRDVLWF